MTSPLGQAYGNLTDQRTEGWTSHLIVVEIREDASKNTKQNHKSHRKIMKLHSGEMLFGLFDDGVGNWVTRRVEEGVGLVVAVEVRQGVDVEGGEVSRVGERRRLLDRRPDDDQDDRENDRKQNLRQRHVDLTHLQQPVLPQQQPELFPIGRRHRQIESERGAGGAKRVRKR